MAHTVVLATGPYSTKYFIKDFYTHAIKTPFARMALGMEDLTGDGGVLKRVLNHGLGSVVPEGASVRVHYNGYLEYCDEPYDSSRLRNREKMFKLGRGNSVETSIPLCIAMCVMFIKVE